MEILLIIFLPIWIIWKFTGWLHPTLKDIEPTQETSNIWSKLVTGRNGGTQQGHAEVDKLYI